MKMFAIKMKDGNWFGGYMSTGRQSRAESLDSAYLYPVSEESDVLATADSLEGASIYEVSISEPVLYSAGAR